MTFEQFKARFLLKLKEQGLASNDIEVLKIFTAVSVLNEYQEKQNKKVNRR